MLPVAKDLAQETTLLAYALCCVVLCCVVLCYVVLGASPYPTRDCPWPDFETREQVNMVELLLTDGSAIPKVQMDLRAARIKGYDEASQQGGAPQNGAVTRPKYVCPPVNGCS